MSSSPTYFRHVLSGVTLLAVTLFGVTIFQQQRQDRLSQVEAEMNRPLTALFERAMEASLDTEPAAIAPIDRTLATSGPLVPGLHTDLLDAVGRSIRPS